VVKGERGGEGGLILCRTFHPSTARHVVIYCRGLRLAQDKDYQTGAPVGENKYSMVVEIGREGREKDASNDAAL
jgi:hypothetical protein